MAILKKRSKFRGYPIRSYIEVDTVNFPATLPIAFAVCSKKCGSVQFMVEGGSQVCDYCGRLMFRTEMREYSLKRIRKPKEIQA